MQKNSRTVLIILLAVGLLAAFSIEWVKNGSENEKTKQSFAGQSPAKRNGDLPDTDSAGPKRVICTSPAVTEIVYALGLGNSVCGVSDFCDYPPEAVKKEKIGGAFNPNRERIIQLAPDLLIGQGKMESISRLCTDSGIPFFSVKLDSLNDIMDACSEIGKKTSHSREGKALSDQLRKSIDEIRNRASQLPKRKVFLVCGRMPGKLAGFLTVGKGSFMDDLLNVCGGVNIFADADGLYPQVSREAVAERRPDVIIEIIASGMKESTREDTLKTWRELGSGYGISDTRVEIVTDAAILKPGPRIVSAAQKLFSLIHPEYRKEKQEAEK